MMVCEVNQLQVFVSDGEGGQRVVLDVPHLEIKPGSLTAIVGASGSGKTTLLHCLTGIHRPTVGSITMQELQLESLTEAQCDAWRHRQVGLIFQDFQLVAEMSALQNVLLPTHFARNDVSATRASSLLALYGIHHPNVPVSRLSRGEKQRVAFARALLFNPAFIIADEPTASLDRENAMIAIAALKNCASQGQTVVVATHDQTIFDAADAVISLAHGRLVRLSAVNVA